MYYLIIGIGIFYLLSSTAKNVFADEIYIPVEGGKNLAYLHVPVTENDIPLAIHIYSGDFPLVNGDYGNVIEVYQRMQIARGYPGIDVTGVLDASTAMFSTSISLDQFKAMATGDPPVAGNVVVYNYKPQIK